MRPASTLPSLLAACGLLAAALSCAVQAAPASSGGSKSTYRWTDANGQVHYGDKVPPQEASKERARINKQGVVTKVLPRELSAQEQAAAEANARAARSAAEVQARQVAYDRYLVQAYASVADLQATRSERLAALDGRLDLAQKAVAETEKALSGLRTRSDAATNKQIEEYEGSLIENLQAARGLREERLATEQRFASDIDRYKRLKTGTLLPGG